MDAITERERLTGVIVGHIRRHGFYLADLDSGSAQALIDLRWAALMAGRHVGCRTETYVSDVGKAVPDRVTVLVAPATWHREARGINPGVRSIVEDLLHLQVSDHDVRIPA